MLLTLSALTQLLWESLNGNFCQYLENLLKHSISAKFLLMEGYAQGALRKELHIAPFGEHFETTTLGKYHGKLLQYLEQYV